MSQLIGRLVSFIVDLFRIHKLKMLTLSVSATLFTIILFPYSDLGEPLSEAITRATGQNVFLAANDLSLSLLPTPALVFSEVDAEVNQPSLQLKINELRMKPGLLGLMTFKPSVRLEADGLAGGQARIDLTVTQQDNAQRTVDTEIETAGVNIGDFPLGLPIPISGAVTGLIKSAIQCTGPQCTLASPLRGEIQLEIDSLRTSGGGMFNLPPFGFSKVQIKGVMRENRLNLAEASLGNNKDPISGVISGDIELSPSMGGGLALGAYRLNLDLSLSSDFEKEYGGLLKTMLRLGQYQVGSGAAGSRYKFSAQGQGFGPMPNIGAPLSL